MKNFATHLKNSHIRSKRRFVRTMQLRGSHEKETVKLNNSNTFEYVQIESASVRDIHKRLSVLESMFMDEIKEFEKMQICEEIAEDLRF